MNLIFFDDWRYSRFYPFSQTRPLADIRCGILTMRKRWKMLLNTESSSSFVRKDLQEVFPIKSEHENILINGALLGTADLVDAIKDLSIGQVLVNESGDNIAFKINKEELNKFYDSNTLPDFANKVIYKQETIFLNNVWDIFSFNGEFIEIDFELLTQNKTSAPIPENVIVSRKERIFIEPGAVIRPCIINATEGPVYIGPDSEIMEGCLIRGPLALGEHATIKMGAKIYGGTTIGKHCKVGGEVNNAVFFNYSNKGHDGFIGNAIIGDWCNIGADTNCSNLRNDYNAVSIWDEETKTSVSTGLQFCGLIMGDHSKCSINTMFNTGTIVGICCNIFGTGFPKKHIPNFTWGGIQNSYSFKLPKAIEAANRMMERRGKKLSISEEKLLETIFNQKINTKNE